MKTHYLRSPDEEVEQLPCGTWVGEGLETSHNWGHVDCKLCLRNRAKIEAAQEAEDKAIDAQYGEWAAHMKAQEKDHG